MTMVNKLNKSGIPLQIEAKDPDTQLKSVAKLYEKQFLREMVKAMRQTVSESGLTKADAGRGLYQEQLDQEYVESWGEQGGIGLADLIYQQLKDRFGGQLGLSEKIEKPKGPLPLDQKANISVQTRAPRAIEAPLNIKVSLDRKNQTQERQELTSPWDGVLTKNFTFDEKNILELKHKNGLISHFIFSGLSKDLQTNQEVQSGDSLGLLSPDHRSFYWEIRKSKTPVLAQSQEQDLSKASP